MAIPTQFSVAKTRKCPIANPTQPVDGANPLTAESIGFISGAYAFSTEGKQGIDAPEEVTPESASNIDAPTPFTAKAGALVSPPFPLNHARILYENILTSGFAVASRGSNAAWSLNPNTWQGWTFGGIFESCTITVTIPENTSTDTICIGGHNLGDVCNTITIETSSTDNGAFTLRETRSIDSNAAIMYHTSTTISLRRVRITAVNVNGTGKIANIAAGTALQMQRPFFNGHQPYTDGDVTEYYAKRTESGERIGRQIRRKGFETSYEWQNLDDSWYRQYMPDFKAAAKVRPIYIAWNLLEYPNDVAFGDILDDFGASMQNGTRTKRSGLSFTVVGV